MHNSSKLNVFFFFESILAGNANEIQVKLIFCLLILWIYLGIKIPFWGMNFLTYVYSERIRKQDYLIVSKIWIFFGKLICLCLSTLPFLFVLLAFSFKLSPVFYKVLFYIFSKKDLEASQFQLCYP